MYVVFRLLTVDEGNYMWMMKGLEDLDLGVEVVPQLLVELLQLYRLDGNKAWLLLYRHRFVSCGRER